MLQWQSDLLEAVSYLRAGRGLVEQEVVVDFSPAKFNMMETVESRRMIEERWAEATAANRRLYNASKFRLAGRVDVLERSEIERHCGRWAGTERSHLSLYHKDNVKGVKYPK